MQYNTCLLICQRFFVIYEEIFIYQCIHFNCSIDIAAKILQTLAISFLNLQNDDTDDQQVIMEVILDGVLKEIVCEERNASQTEVL